MYDVALPAAMSLGSNISTLMPGNQPLVAFGVVARDIPSLMSQLALAGATLQNSLMAQYNSHGILPSNNGGLSLGFPNTLAQSDYSSVHDAVTPQTSDHDEHRGNVC